LISRLRRALGLRDAEPTHAWSAVPPAAKPAPDRSSERRIVPAPFTGELREALIAKTLRVARSDGAAGDGAAAARQLDVALMSVGFKASRELLDHLSGLHPVVAADASAVVLRSVRQLVGDHVEHNPYFIEFPANVPDTLEFWTACVAHALLDPRSADNVGRQLRRGQVNLLDLPTYGTYQHTYEQMLELHDQLVPDAHGRTTLLSLGDSLPEESHALYLSLAGARGPLSDQDLSLLAVLAELHSGDPQPAAIDVRENRAVVNASRLRHGRPIDIDTPTDVLRLAAVLSQGDVTLDTPTRFHGIRRSERRALLQALDDVARSSAGKLADIPRQREAFKRLGEQLHPHEYPEWPGAQDAFAVARGERTARSLAGRVDLALAGHRPDEALTVLEHAPGLLLRTVDRLLREGADVDRLVQGVRAAAPATSTRVLLSLREHLMNRATPLTARAFVNQRGRLWSAPDERPPLSHEAIRRLNDLLDVEIGRRLPHIEHLTVDPAARAVAVPLTSKNRPDGLGLLPRGSTQSLTNDIRFFVAWKQRAKVTDYDLSVLLLDEDFASRGQVSWTNLRGTGVTHSGDVTEAPDAATEFIDVDLNRTGATYVVPQVNVYSGERFDQCTEAFFGFMERRPADRGRPFEPRTVTAKSDLLGRGRVALPVLFARTPQNEWHALWMHLNLPGWPSMNRVEGNAHGTSLVVRALHERQYLRMSYLEDLLRARGTNVDAALDGDSPITYVGLSRPEHLPAGSVAYTPEQFVELLSPA